MMKTINKHAELYRTELLEKVIPFWLKHSLDKEYGGYFTCLDRAGNVFDSDKFIWLQCRQVWTFAMLYNEVEKKQEWLDFVLQGADFLIKKRRYDNVNSYFYLNSEWRPLIQTYNIISDSFASIAYGQLYKATKQPEHLQIAKDTFFNIIKRQDNPKGKYSNAYPGTRNLQN